MNSERIGGINRANFKNRDKQSLQFWSVYETVSYAISYKNTYIYIHPSNSLISRLVRVHYYTLLT